jgi:hypothetical protein
MGIGIMFFILFFLPSFLPLMKIQEERDKRVSQVLLLPEFLLSWSKGVLLLA